MAVHIDRAPGGTAQAITIRRHSNFHAHLRQGELLQAIAKHLMRHVLYLVVMPNTNPIIRTGEDAVQYYARLWSIAYREGFERLKLIMTLYHTADITPAVIERMAASAIVRAVKHYPPEPGATTGSGHGISLDDPRSDEQFRVMAELKVPLLGHFESVKDDAGRTLHPRDGEAYFVRRHLWRFRDRHPNLRICFEHASTAEAIEFVKADPSGNTFMTVTPHHGSCTEGDFARSWGNHLKCKPRVQPAENQAAIAEFITSGDPRVGAGDDTAAHLASAKAKPFDQAPNGAFWTSHGIAMYAAIFERAGALDQRFEDFMSLNAPRWWGLPLPAEDDTITLVRETERDVPDPVAVPELDDFVIPLGWTKGEDRLRIGWAVKD